MRIALAVLLWMSALAAHGQGTIRYVNLGGVQFPSLAAGSFQGEFGIDTPVDIDNNGTTDLLYRSPTSFSQFVLPTGNNAIMGRLNPLPDLTSYVMPLYEGHLIGPTPSGSLSWVPERPSGHPLVSPLGSYLSACYDFGCLGLFIGKTAYMGVQFDIDGQTHYGWMHLRSEVSGSTVYGFAYNTVPGQPILAGQVPEPGTVALLLVGGSLIWWRIKRVYRSC